MQLDVTCGQNCIISENASLGRGVTLGHNCIIEENVVLNRK